MNAQQFEKLRQRWREEDRREWAEFSVQLKGKNELACLKILTHELLRKYFYACQCDCNGGPYPAGMGNYLIDAVREMVGDRSGLLDREAYESEKREWKWQGDEVMR